MILVALESPERRTLALALTFALAVTLAFLIARPAVAWYLARDGTISALERAVAWDPGSPDLHLRLGNLHGGGLRADPVRSREHLETAMRLRRTDVYPLLGLALVAERNGDHTGARQFLDTALRLDPHNVAVRWEAAVLHFGWGDRDTALEHFRYLVAVDPSQRDAAFELARTLFVREEDAVSLLPGDSGGLTHVLEAAIVHEDLPLARAGWTKRVAMAPRLPDRVARRYLDLLVKYGDGAQARRVWFAAIGADAAGSDGNAVWNGGFETDHLLGWGLDWQVRRVWGVEVTLDGFVAARGRRSLRLAFNSFPTLNFGGVWQLVAVQPGRTYRLTALARATDFTTQSGLKLQVIQPEGDRVLAETTTVSGTTDWSPVEAEVRIPETVSLVVLRVRREPAPRPEGNLGGKVWLDEVRLQ